MIAATLFAKRGPDEPVRHCNLFQDSPAYVMGREDFLFGREFDPTKADALGRHADRGARQHTYRCAWAHEQQEASDHNAQRPEISW